MNWKGKQFGFFMILWQESDRFQFKSLPLTSHAPNSSKYSIFLAEANVYGTLGMSQDTVLFYLSHLINSYNKPVKEMVLSPLSS